MLDFLTPTRRQHLYLVLTALVPILVAYGVVATADVSLWIALAAAVLGTGTAALHTNTKRDPDA